MKIVSSQFNLKNEALEIYISGCYGDCVGCHNSELKDFNLGTDYKSFIIKALEKINESKNLIKRVFIMGGEPLDQNIFKLYNLISEIKQTNTEVWLFTRYELDEVPKIILSVCDYVKTGKYDNTKLENITKYNITLASNNQNIHKIRS